MQNNATSSLESIFKDFFHQRGHAILSSSSLLDDSIPMSFVMSAGWVQIEKRIKNNLTHRNLQNTAFIQNCFRHFDMKKVGYSPMHLSLFRMMGAFHFGEINTASQIANVFRLLTENYALPTQHLWVTFFAGGEVNRHSFDKDKEVANTWAKLGIPEKHIIGNTNTQNFWMQSSKTPHRSRKCGSTSEVFFDRGEEFSCGPNCGPGCSCGRFVEIVNMLFIRHECTGENEIAHLPVPFTEIVTGAERMAMVKQKCDTIFQIDTLSPLVAAARDTVPYGISPEPRYLHVIADHIRALFFLTGDGAPHPGKGGRAFIVRKLMRETFTAMKMLEISQREALPHLAEAAVRLYAPIHPPVADISAQLLSSLNKESQRFEQTLQRGARRLEHLLAQQSYRAPDKETIQIFEKSFGMPRPLLLRLLQEKQDALTKTPPHREENHDRA